MVTICLTYIYSINVVFSSADFWYLDGSSIDEKWENLKSEVLKIFNMKIVLMGRQNTSFPTFHFVMRFSKLIYFEIFSISAFNPPRLRHPQSWSSLTRPFYNFSISFHRYSRLKVLYAAVTLHFSHFVHEVQNSADNPTDLLCVYRRFLQILD